MDKTSKVSEESNLIVDKETGELRPRKQEGGPGRKPKPPEEKAGVYEYTPFNPEEEYTRIGTTRKGKDLNIKRDHRGNYYFEFDKGGLLPPKLKGKYTHYEYITQAAKLYLEGYM